MSAASVIDLGACLVTGADTAVGRAVVCLLRERGAGPIRVTQAGAASSQPEGALSVIDPPRDSAEWAKACTGVTTLFHCSPTEASPSAARRPRNGQNPQAMLAACRDGGVSRVVYASGDAAVLGEDGISAEARVRNEAGNGLATCAVRSGQLWGSAGEADLLGELVRLAARGWYVARPPEGEVRCELTSVERLADAMLSAADRLAEGGVAPGPVWAVTDGPAVDPLRHFEPVLRELGFEPPSRRMFASWLIAWAALWSGLHRVYLATEPPVTTAFWRRLTRARLEDPGTVEAGRRALAPNANFDGTLNREQAFEHAERVLEEWGRARCERIGSSWSLPFFIRLPNLRGTLAAITRIHRWSYLVTAGRIGHVMGSTTFLLVHNVGRKSGREFLTPLLYVADGSRFVIAASNAGDARAPAWWLNLQASPDTIVQAGNRRVRVRARRAEVAEAEMLWPRMVASYRWFRDYHEKAGREIPLILLEPIRTLPDA